LKLGEDSCAEIFDGNTVEPAWVWAAEKMERDDVVAVLGRPDSGKTSYTTLAANIAVSKYGRCSVVSLDPGQTYFTPPTVVGAAAVEKQVYDLAELKPFWQVPVGTTSAPHGAAVILEMLVGLAERLVRPVLVDMDGWVEGSARRSPQVRHTQNPQMHKSSPPKLGKRNCVGCGVRGRDSRVKYSGVGAC
jgi:polynucleotide 5'-kinase involved in rRNA processing